MIPNVTRGSKMAGLLSYLAGEGKRNEHTDPHLVAGSSDLMLWQEDVSLDHASALTVAKHLDRPRRAFGTEVSGGHVWHCSLAIAAEEGVLSEDKWREISESMIAKMGFDDAEGTKSPTRWASVRHGLSQNGNDHVHLVVNLVREDGTKASVHKDFARAQKAARELEREHGLRQLSVAKGQRSSVGFKPGERESLARRRAYGKFQQARRDGDEQRQWSDLGTREREVLVGAQLQADQPRWELARKVRGAATAAEDEAEFVRRLRRQGVLVRPRFAQGTTDVITGFSVASKPKYGERPIWYGGGSLAHDLSLTKLRGEWPDRPDAAISAAAEWSAAQRGRRPVQPGREMQEADPQLWLEAGRDLDLLREQLRAVPADDFDTWARVARQTSGAFAAWSSRVEATPGPLAATSDALARSAEIRHIKPRDLRTPTVSLSGTAMVLAAVSKPGKNNAATLVMMTQLANLAKALHDAHRATHDASRARQIEVAVRTQLVEVGQRLEGATTSPERGTYREDVAAAIAQARQPKEQAQRPIRAADLDAVRRPTVPVTVHPSNNIER